MSASTKSDRYRPDIDGLRAIAVAVVVAYHAKVLGVAGGFLGVDIFFVISGFVITRLLIAEQQANGRLDLPAFWRRRIARLWPALALVLVFVLLVTPLFVSRMSGEIGPMARAALAALAINANHFFLLESADYFAAATEANPLLHTWSLSVEEQFYLVWPLALGVLLRRFQTRGIIVGVVVAAMLSFALAVALAQQQPTWAFYLLPARAWQLFVGVALALIDARRRVQPRGDASPGNTLIGGVGLCLIAAAVMWDSRGSGGGLPVIAALAVLGAALTIEAGSRQWFGLRVLESRVLVYVGRISYPLYLWHWPLLAIARGHRLYAASPMIDAACIAIAVLLSVVTYELVEKRAQQRLRALTWRRLTIRWLGSTVAIAGLALLVGVWTRFGWGYNERERWLAPIRFDHSNVGCIFAEAFPPPMEEQKCYPRKHGTSILMWGDSHAQHWSPAFARLAGESGVDYASFALGGCRPVPRREPGWRCGRFYSEVARRVDDWKANAGLVGVVLSARWAAGTGAVPLSAVDQAQERITGYDDRAAHSEAEALALLRVSLREQLSFLVQRGLRVLVILPSPNQRFAAVHCPAMKPDSECFTTRAENDAYSGKVKALMREVIAGFADARAFDAEPLLCNDRVCPAVVNGFVAYSDDDHLSRSWTNSAAPAMRAEFDWLTTGRLDSAPGRAR